MIDRTYPGMTIADTLAYLEQFPDKRFDIVDGELVDVSPKPIHGRLQAVLTALLVEWTRHNPVGTVHTEVLHVLNGEQFIPDISINAHTADDAAYFDKPPMLAVEIRSDTQSRPAQRRKAARYLANGTPAVLIIMPGESVELHTPNADAQTFKQGDTVQNIPGLAGLTIAVDALLG